MDHVNTIFSFIFKWCSISYINSLHIKMLIFLLLLKKKYLVFLYCYDTFYWQYNLFQKSKQKKRLRNSRNIYRSTAVMSMHAHWPLPLPAKGRTNIELREQFILAEGVSQSMSAFKPKTPSQQRSVSISSGSAGPITKVTLQTCHHIMTSSTFCHDRLGHLITATNLLLTFV